MCPQARRGGAPLHDGRTAALDLAAIDRALGEGARPILLCNPHNPLGLIHARSDLTEPSQILARHRASVVSDEIHGPLTHSGATFTPDLTVSDEARAVDRLAAIATFRMNIVGPAPENLPNVSRMYCT